MSLMTWSDGKPRFKQDEPSRHETARDRKAAYEKAWREMCAVIDKRDGKACRCCDKRSDPEATGLLARGHRHHLVYRSAGGTDESSNVVTLCASCHDDEHRNRLRIEGNPDERLTFWRKDEAGGWYVAREETAVRTVRKD